MTELLLETTFLDAQTNFHVYIVKGLDHKIVYVGYNKLLDIVAMKELLKNPEFDQSKKWTIRIVSTHVREIDARNNIASVLETHNAGRIPELNMRSAYNRVRVPVVCDQTGIKYKNASEAATQLNINQSQLSKHLARKTGAKSIKGLTFHYASQGE